MAEAILNQPHFQDAEKAREYLEALRWANGVVCPHCASIKAHYKLKGKATRPGVYKCVDCSEQFTVTVGTVFERSKIALNIWLQAVHLMCASKKGISSKQLERMLGVTYKTAWSMSHRIREAMTTNPSGLLGGGGSTVEVDETYWGNTHQSKIGKLVGTKQGGHQKEKIVSMVERGGNVRSFHVETVSPSTLKEVMEKNIHKDTQIHTDGHYAYRNSTKGFAGHEFVNHGAGEYVRGNVTTNSIEDFFPSSSAV